MIDAERESAKPSKTGLTLGLSQFPAADKNCERVGHLQWPECGHFDSGAPPAMASNIAAVWVVA